jgi:hypothetical protein
LDALGAAALPDPTTAGDFCRRFDDADATIVGTEAKTKEGMDISY